MAIYAVALAELDQGQAANECIITNTAQFGSLTIVKDASPPTGRDFPFTMTSPQLMNPIDFTLDDEPVQPNDAFNDTITFPDLLAGPYTITEFPTADFWALLSVVCQDPTGNEQVLDIDDTIPGQFQVIIDLQPGQALTCSVPSSMITPTSKKMIARTIRWSSSSCRW